MTLLIILEKFAKSRIWTNVFEIRLSANTTAFRPDAGKSWSRHFRLIAHGNDSNTDFKRGIFRDFTMCIKYPAFYVSILRDILQEQMPDHLPKELLGSIVECHIRGMLPEWLAAEYHVGNANEINYINVVDKTAVEINVSNKPIKGTHFDCLPDGYKCCLLTKDKTGTIGNIRLIPYYDFINNGAKLDGRNTDRNDDLIGGYTMPNEHLYLEQDDREHRVKARELTEEDDWLLVELAEKYGNDFKEGTDLREKQLQWRKEHGRPNI